MGQKRRPGKAPGGLARPENKSGADGKVQEPEVIGSEAPLKSECDKALIALRRGNSPKAVKLIKDATQKYPLVALGHRVNGHIHLKVANMIEDATVKQRHFRTALEAAKQATSLSARSVEYAHFYAQLLFEAASDSKGYDEVIRECERALNVEEPIDPAKESLQEENAQELQTPEARINHVQTELKQMVQKANLASLSTWVKTFNTGNGEEKLRFLQVRKLAEDPMEQRVAQPKRPHEVKKSVKTVEERRKEIEVRVAAARLLQQRQDSAEPGSANGDAGEEGEGGSGKRRPGDKRRKDAAAGRRGGAKMRPSEERLERVKPFWTSAAPDVKQSMLDISIEDLKQNLAASKNSEAAEVLAEALQFAQDKKTWRFWVCCRCSERFTEAQEHMQHVMHTHIGKLTPKQQKVLPQDLEPEWVEMLMEEDVKPINAPAAIKLLIESAHATPAAVAEEGGPAAAAAAEGEEPGVLGIGARGKGGGAGPGPSDSASERSGSLSSRDSSSSLENYVDPVFASLEESAPGSSIMLVHADGGAEGEPAGGSTKGVGGAAHGHGHTCNGDCQRRGGKAGGAADAPSPPDLPLVEDEERQKLLGRVHHLFRSLMKVKCLSGEQVLKVVQYAIDELQSLVPEPGVQYEFNPSPLYLRFLDAGQLKNIIKYLADLGHTCGLERLMHQEAAAAAAAGGDGCKAQAEPEDDIIQDRLLLNEEFTQLLLDERVLKEVSPDPPEAASGGGGEDSSTKPAGPAREGGADLPESKGVHREEEQGGGKGEADKGLERKAQEANGKRAKGELEEDASEANVHAGDSQRDGKEEAQISPLAENGVSLELEGPPATEAGSLASQAVGDGKLSDSGRAPEERSKGARERLSAAEGAAGGAGRDNPEAKKETPHRAKAAAPKKKQRYKGQEAKEVTERGGDAEKLLRDMQKGGESAAPSGRASEENEEEQAAAGPAQQQQQQRVEEAEQEQEVAAGEGGPKEPVEGSPQPNGLTAGKEVVAKPGGETRRKKGGCDEEEEGEEQETETEPEEGEDQQEQEAEDVEKEGKVVQLIEDPSLRRPLPLMQVKDDEAGPPPPHVELQLAWIFGRMEYELLPSAWRQHREEVLHKGREICESLKKELAHIQGLCEKKRELVAYEDALHRVEKLCAEAKDRAAAAGGGGGRGGEGRHSRRRGHDHVLKGRLEELRHALGTTHQHSNSRKVELEVLQSVLRDAQNVQVCAEQLPPSLQRRRRRLLRQGPCALGLPGLLFAQVPRFGFQDALTMASRSIGDGDDDDESARLMEHLNKADLRVETAINTQRDNLANEQNQIDAKLMRSLDTLSKVENGLTLTCVLDYRMPVLPLVKALLQKSDAAQEAFLAELAKDEKPARAPDSSKAPREKLREKKKSRDSRKGKDQKEDLLASSHSEAPSSASSGGFSAPPLPTPAAAFDGYRPPLPGMSGMSGGADTQRSYGAVLAHDSAPLDTAVAGAAGSMDVSPAAAMNRASPEPGAAVASGEGQVDGPGHVAPPGGVQGGVVRQSWAAMAAAPKRAAPGHEKSASSWERQTRGGGTAVVPVDHDDEAEDDDMRFQADLQAAMQRSLDEAQQQSRHVNGFKLYGGPTAGALPAQSVASPPVSGSSAAAFRTVSSSGSLSSCETGLLDGDGSSSASTALPLVPAAAGAAAAAQDDAGQGLQNEVGQYNCFLNVVIQFREELLREGSGEHVHQGDPCVVCALRGIFVALSTPGGSRRECHKEAVAPTALRLALSAMYSETEFFQQVKVILWLLLGPVGPYMFPPWVLGWQKSRESLEDISLTVEAIDTDMDIGVIYRGLAGPHPVQLVSVEKKGSRF
eukprot:jgi/Mesen1/6720/ME000344S05998